VVVDQKIEMRTNLLIEVVFDLRAAQPRADDSAELGHRFVRSAARTLD
jgi:hypothetical protein